MDTTYGIELEVTVPSDTGFRAAMRPYVGGGRGTQGAWDLRGDGTIHPRRRHGHPYEGIEVVSPVLRGMEQLNKVAEVCEILRAHDAFVNRSTGAHVHIGYDNMSIPEADNAVKVFDVFEMAFYGVGGASAPTRMNGSYCRSMKSTEYLRRYDDEQRRRVEEQLRQQDSLPTLQKNAFRQRYLGLNMTNFAANQRDSGYGGGYGAKKTLEFRCFAGTTNPRKATGSILMSHALVMWSRANSVDSLPFGPIATPTEAMQKFFSRCMLPQYLPNGCSSIPGSVVRKLFEQAAVATERINAAANVTQREAATRAY